MNNNISIIIASGNDAPVLENVVPKFVCQQYDGNYEVIVCNESLDEEIADVIKRLKTQYPQLNLTFVPRSAVFINRHRMAITLGVKAAQNDWVIIPDATCQPEGDDWLARLSPLCGEDEVTLPYMALKYTRNTKLANRCVIVKRDVFLAEGGLSNNAHFHAKDYNKIIRHHFLRLYGEHRSMGMKLSCWMRWIVRRII